MRLRVALLSLLLAANALAQHFTWSEDFQGTAVNTRPAEWVADAPFRALPDPAQSGNVAYGAREAVSRQRAVGRGAPGERPEGGSHATLANRWLTAARGFEYRGRFFRANDSSHVGFTFFSQQPEGTSEYLVAMWRGSMRLFGPQLVADSGFVPRAGRWHRFVIRAEEEGSATRIRARFWIDGQTEPVAWQLDATDPATSRLAGGRIGIWAAGGAAYVDDLAVAGEIVLNADLTPPSIAFRESGRDLPKTNAFSRDVRVDVEAVDGSGIASLSVTLDGAAYVSGDPIATERAHELSATAIDGAGNSATASISLLIDKTPPVIAVRNVASNALYSASVTPEVTVQDLTETTVSATLNGQPFALGSTIGDERAHTLVVTAVDALGWTTTTPPIRFTIDRTPPAIAFLEAGRVLEPGARNVLDHDARVEVRTAEQGTTVSMTVDGQPYLAGTPITGEGTHAIRARVTDAAGNVTSAEIAIVIDKTRPAISVTSIPPFTNQVVRPVITVADATETTLLATLDGEPYASGTAIDAERRHTLVVSATDEAGWTTTLAPIVFTIDRTPPSIAFVAPAADAMLVAPRVVVTGDSGDAASVVVNGVVATLDTVLKTFTATVELIEGANTLTVVATDVAGNQTTITRAVRLDTRVPLLTVTSPAGDACLDATQVELRGTVSDASGATVRVNGVAANVSGSAWTVTIPTPNETRVLFAIEASDPAGHTATLAVAVTIDRTRPGLELTESGAPLSDTVTSRSLAIFGRAIDADNTATVPMTLDGQPYASGTPITAEKSYVLTAVANDCAGHASDARTVRFTIDRTPPAISALTPASGATVGTKPAITGRLSEEATVIVEGTGETASVSGLDFSLNAALNEGGNALTLIARDRAGNESRWPLAFTVKTVAPTIEITENGSPVAADALFNRAVTPVIRVNDPQATVAATLDGQPFTSGTPVSADGRHTLSATVTDVVNRTAAASATFTIDRTPPRVTITSPAANAAIATATLEVRGSVDADDVARVLVNGVSAALSGTNFSATIPADTGSLSIVVLAFDRAGNAGSASVDVARAEDRIGILLTSPVDGLLTNRPATVVAGQVLTSTAPRKVMVNGIELPVDAAGAFRKVDFPLVEGDNAITATAGSSAVTVHVIADFTPPVLKVMADGVELADAARFATAPAITLQATDNMVGGVATQLTVDGAPVVSASALPFGGHSLTAIARDAAGNETRVDRTFVIGQSAVALGCSIVGLDPANDSSVFGEHVRVTGRANAEAVLVNGARAAIADGTFCADVTLAAGRNEVVLQCARADGAPSGESPVTLVLHRWLDPEVAITSPAPGSVITASRITVTGTVGAGVVSGDVNGLPFTPAGGAFTVSDVAVAPGLNVIAARARTASDRMTVATTRVVARTAAPQIAITSPLSGTSTGAAAIDVTGTYANVDPATIAIANSSVTTQPLSDTTGRFSATVSIASNMTITATARGFAGANVSASVDVSRVASAPSISFAAPFDNAFVASTSETVRVTGTFVAGDGAQVSVNGLPAAVSGSSFTADVDLAPASTTPIVARVNAADGTSATDAIRVTRFAGPLAVKETFPAVNASGVDRGIAIVVLMSNALDATTVANAVRVADGANNVVPGDLFVDRDAIAFAPHAALRAGERYTVTIAETIRDLAGGGLASAQAFGFTAATTAPSTPPVIDQSDAAGCLGSQTITGRTSVPGARVRLDVDGVSTITIASASNAFTFNFTLSGQPGYHAVRVREIGSDGTLSPERALCLRVNCAAPQVLGATLDRGAKKLAVQFSKPMDAATVTIVVEPALAGTTSWNASGDTATMTFDAELANVTLKVTVPATARDRGGLALLSEFTRTFEPGAQGGVERGKGFVSGAVYDATNGRPLANVTVTIGGESLITDARGRYSRALDEGAWTLRASATNYSTVWRQVIVPAGAGVVPIDIRLTKQGPEHVANGGAATLTHGGDTSVTRPVSLALGPASLPNGVRVRLTAIGAQSLAGLLPLGWSPLAAAEISADQPPIGARLAFTVDPPATNTLSLAWYDETRDEWRVEVPVVGTPSFDIAKSGNYALVYPDAAPHLAHPPIPRAGAALTGVADPCAATPDVCRLTGRSFTLEPKAVVPNGRSVATLITEGATQTYPSGTVVQAFIDEQLNLADGRVLVEPPFATDLIVHRTLAGDAGVADFHLAPSAQAATVVLRDGVEQIRIVDYPGRIARGTLLGAGGGRLPGGDGVTIDVPAGATLEPLHASVASFDVASIGSVAGFRVAAGFTLTLTRASAPPVEGATLTLLKPVTATVSVTNASQVVIGEVVSDTPFGTLIRLAAVTSPGATTGGARLFTTREASPVEGIVREGRYVVLVAEAPIAFAHGQVRAIDANGPAVANARVTANGIGVVDLTKTGGLFVVPVLAKPAAPFSLTPRTIATGDGATRVHTTSPDPDAMIDVGALPLASQAPRLVEVTPADDAAIDATAAFVVQARFDAPIDPSSVAGGITLSDRTTGAALSGTVAAAGNVVTFNASAPLTAASSYAIAIAPSIRGTNGAPFGRTHVTSFTTRAVPAGNTAIRPDRIRITIPDANGRSIITGAAGALPAGAQAVAVRRGRFFIASYTATVATDGSFTFDAGHQHEADRIVVTDALDLRVLDPVSKAIIAVIPLTPFASADGKSFLAPPDRETQFTSADGIRVFVPEGAFAEATLVRVEPAPASAFDGVPNFATELRFAAGVSLQFDGVAQKRLEITIPAPATIDASRKYFLGHLGMSSRGPRVMIVDLLRVDGNAFTTALAETTVQGGREGGMRVAADQVLSGREVRDFLLGATRSGQYGAVDFPNPIAWIVMQGMDALHELFFDTMSSIFAAQYYVAERGRVLVPVAANRAFTVSGVDTTSGFTNFTRRYEALAPSDPAVAVNVPSPVDNVMGPYPVFALPGRVEIFDLTMEPLTDASRRNVVLTFDGGTARLRGGTPALPAGTRVEMINLNRPPAASEAFDGEVEVPARKGDRIVVVIGERDVDPSTAVSVTFSKPIFTGDGDADLRAIVKLGVKAPGADEYSAVAAKVYADSGGRRVIVDLGADLQRGKLYQLVLSRAIRDTAESPLTLAQPAGGSGLADDLRIEFSTRAPAGEIASFELPMGTVRDLAMSGNILFVSALEGGVYAYDASNPVGMTTSGPFARAEAPIGAAGAPGQTWAVATDHHNRLFTTGMSSMFGVVRSYRVEDFIAGGTVAARANAIVSWRPGVNVGLPVGTSYVTLSDRPEAVPRRVRIATQDDDPIATSWADLTSGAIPVALDASNTIFKATVGVARPPANFPYLRQRVTIVNRTSGFRWSLDVTRNGATPPSEEKVTIVGRPTDQFEIIRNVATYSVVTLFGFGVGVYDVNAIESNRFAIEAGVAAYAPLRERVLATEADEHPLCDPTADRNAPLCDPAKAAREGQYCPIPDLRFSPEAAVTSTSQELVVYGLEQHRGIVQLHVRPPSEIAPAASCRRPDSLVLAERVNVSGQVPPACGSTPPVDSGSVPRAHPRLNALRRLYRGASNCREPVGRFTSIATYYDQQRGKRYGLVAGRDFGVIVVELDPLVGIGLESVADVIWIPAGAWAVRVFEEHRLAAVIDGKGRTLLVDLKKIDQRDENETLDECSTIECEWPLFPTAAASIAGSPGEEGEVGVDDPRIVWKSDVPADGLVTTLPPLVDPETGFLYRGDTGDATVRVTSAIDPRLRVLAELGTNTLQPLSSVVPLGIAPPGAGLADSPNKSRAAFRIALTVPGSLAESIGSVALTIENERVPGARTPQPPDGFPRAQLDVMLERPLPPSNDADVKKLRYQRASNRLLSPWIVAIADPRASAGSEATADCVACTRPPHLAGLDVRELFSNGRSLAIRANPATFTGGYAYLGDGRLDTRIATVPADTVRAPSIRVAALNPPIAIGMLQETTYVHSGEVESTAIDLVPGGRAGMAVAIDRTYRSRTIGGTVLGPGWESSNFVRLRELPNTNVEYRDAAGEIWTFRRNGSSSTYTSPAGLFVALVKREDGTWRMRDQQSRFVWFDALGRLSARSDDFSDPSAIATGADRGNVIRYLYDPEGRLARIVDPVGRVTDLRYWPDSTGEGAYAGHLREVEDWRHRKVGYRYDAKGRLTKVVLPALDAGPDVPDRYRFPAETRAIEYVYDDTTGVDFAGNLLSIKEPGTTAKRIELTYDRSSNRTFRDKVTSQKWATGESATFEYEREPDVTRVTDALLQVRDYKLVTAGDGNRHVQTLTEEEVPVARIVAQLNVAPVTIPIDEPALVTTFTYDAQGELKSITTPAGRTETITNTSRGGVPGTIVTQVAETGGTNRSVTIAYDSVEGAAARPASVSRSEGGSEVVTRETPVASRAHRRLARVEKDGGVTIGYETIVNEHGQVVLDRTIAAEPDPDPARAEPTEAPTTREQTSVYGLTSATNENERGRLLRESTTGGVMDVRYAYVTRGVGGETITVTDVPRKVETTLSTDAADRVIRRLVVETDTRRILADERFGYDASGRLAYTQRSQGARAVIEETQYDDVGRLAKTTLLSGAEVFGQPAVLTTETRYFLGVNVDPQDLQRNKITEIGPYKEGEQAAAPRTTTLLDRMGRPSRIERTAAGSESTLIALSYDRHGEVTHRSDTVRSATITMRDPRGREIYAVDSYGVSTKTTWTPWDEPHIVETFDRDDNLVSGSIRKFTSKGRMRATFEEADASSARVTWQTWDGGGRTVGQRVGSVPDTDTATIPSGPMRVFEATRDASGRVTLERSGEGSGISGDLDAEHTYGETSYANFSGALPTSIVRSEPRASVSVKQFVAYDGLGRDVLSFIPGYTTRTVYDEAGNATKVQSPGRMESEANELSYDGRGLLLSHTQADETIIRSEYDALGALRRRIDEKGEATEYRTDGLGRVVEIVYPDQPATTELIRYEAKTGRIRATKNRAGRWRSFLFNARGDVTQVHNVETPEADDLGTMIERREYDGAGRLTKVANRDAAIQYADFDFLGRPRLTRSYRYRDASGLASAPVLLDVHTQRHEWNVHDERTRFSMPAAGTEAMPATSSARWQTWIDELRDAGGNVTEIRDANGTLLTAKSRSQGRLFERSRGGLRSSYRYADAGDQVTAQLEETKTVRSLDGATVAGDKVVWDGTRRAAEIDHLAFGGHRSFFGYRNRGSLERSQLLSSSTPVRDEIEKWSFRTERFATEELTADQHDAIGEAIARELEVKRWVATETPGHQLGARSVYFEGTPATIPNAVAGGLRTSDGKWTFAYDEFDRLRTATSATQRITYVYNPGGRIVGRTAEKLENGTWTPDAADPFGAATTFVWDPLTDRLASVHTAGASTATGATAETGLLRQYLHGDRGYDDPILVVTASDAFVPLRDETGTGNLAAVASPSGSLIERVLYADAWGDAPRYLAGPVVEKITFTARTDSTGAVASIVIDAPLSEAIDPTSLAGARIGSITATLANEHTLRWTLTPTQWSSLPADLDIALTNELRFPAWGNTSVMPPPEWATSLHSGLESTSTTPFRKREPLAPLQTFLASLGANTESSQPLYEIPTLYLAGTRESKSKLWFEFKAYPFREPSTGLVYARARWYDAETGTFLTPDPLGYQDSSNLYAFCGGDPINCSDPRGEDGYDDKQADYIKWYSGQVDAIWQKRKRLGEQIGAQRAITSDTGLLEAEDRILAQQMMTFGGTPENAVTFFEAARARGDASVLSMSFDQIHAAVVSDEGVRNVGAAVVAAFRPHLARTDGINFRGAWNRAKRFVNDAVDTYNRSIWSSEVGAVGAVVHNRPKLANPLPKNGVFSRVITRAHYEAWKTGKAPIGGPETWVTANVDIAHIKTSRGIARRLTLLDDVGNLRAQDFVRIDLRLRDPLASGLRSAVETVPPRGYGFVGHGRTARGAREWLIDPSAELDILNEVVLAPFK